MGSATTTCWGREASTSSPGAPTSWRGSCRPRPGARARSRGREGGAHPRPHPGLPLQGGAALVPGRPGHRAVLRRALGRGRLPAGGPPTGRDCDFPRLPAPRRGGRQVPLPLTLPRLLLGHRRPRRAGLPHLRRRGTPLHPSARAAAPGRRLRPLRPAGLAAGVLRSGPRHPAQGRGAGIDTNYHSNDREVIETCPTTWTTHSYSTTRGSPWLTAAGPAASWPRASAACYRGGRPPSSWSTTTGWSPTTCWPRPTGVPSATRSTSSGTKTPAPMDTAIPAFPPLRQLPAHRLRRQRRRAACHGREPAG